MPDTTLILAFVILFSGWIPPFIVFYMTYRLSNKTLEKAEGIRTEAIGRAEEIRKAAISEIHVLKNRVDGVQNEISMTVGDLRGDLYRAQKLMKEGSLTPDREKKLKADIEKLIITHGLTDERLKDIKKDLRKSMMKAIDGKIGAEVKKVKNDLMGDPQSAAIMEQYEAGGGEIDTGQIITMRILNTLLPKP
jgi:hypothetical protein